MIIIMFASALRRGAMHGQAWRATASCLTLTPVRGMASLDRKHVLKKFYKEAGVKKEGDGNFAVTLDNRVIKTTKGNRLVVPSEPLAQQIAMEWGVQEKTIKPNTMHMTALASTAIDSMSNSLDNQQIKVELLTEYLVTDGVCFRVAAPEELRNMQMIAWDPLIAWYNDRFGVTLRTTDSLIPPEHSEDAAPKLSSFLEKLNPWHFTAYENAISVLHSAVIASSVMERHITVQEAIAASYMEAEYQRDVYGRCEDEDGLNMEEKTACVAAAVLMARWTQP